MSVINENLGKLTYLDEDLAYGSLHESINKAKIEDFFNCNLTHTGKTYSEFCSFDFEDTEKRMRFELKSRRDISVFKYSTTVIGKNKIDMGRMSANSGWDFYFVFEFVEGLYYVKYEDSNLGTLKGRQFKRLNGEIKNNVDIPVGWLSKMSRPEPCPQLLEAIQLGI